MLFSLPAKRRPNGANKVANARELAASLDRVLGVELVSANPSATMSPLPFRSNDAGATPRFMPKSIERTAVAVASES